MPIVVDRSGNNPGNPVLNGWDGTDDHIPTTKELQQDYYASGGASAFSQTLFPLTTALTWRVALGVNDAANLTTGLLDPARIPVIYTGIQVVSSGGIANLTAPQQAQITAGAVVTTTDGRRWIYASGTKTLEASYIELSDVTPDWSVIANKPTAAAVPLGDANATAGVLGSSALYAKEDHQHPFPLATVNAQTGTSYTLAASDHGKIVKFSNAAAVTVTLPNSLPAGFNCGIASGGAGKVTFTAQAGGTLQNRQSFFSLAGNKAEGSLRVDTNGGTNADWWISGDLQA